MIYYIQRNETTYNLFHENMLYLLTFGNLCIKSANMGVGKHLPLLLETCECNILFIKSQQAQDLAIKKTAVGSWLSREA